MGYFSDVADAKPSKDSPNFRQGKHKTRIDACKIVESQKQNTAYFVVETTLLETSDEHEYREVDRKSGEEVGPVQKWTPGISPAWRVDLGKKMGPANVKGFVCALSGVRPDHEDATPLTEEYWSKQLGMEVNMEQLCEFIVGSDNPLGEFEIEMECNCKGIITENGFPFTVVNWDPRDVNED